MHDNTEFLKRQAQEYAGMVAPLLVQNEKENTSDIEDINAALIELANMIGG